MNRALIERCAIAVSLATLFFLRSWAALTRMIQVDAGAPAVAALFTATLVNVAAASAVFLILRYGADRIGGRAITIAHAGVLMVLITPVDYLDSMVRQLTVRWVAQPVYIFIFTALLVAPLVAAAFLAMGNSRLYQWFRRGVLLASPLIFTFSVSAGWSIFASRNSAAAQLAGPLADPGPQRLVWIIFDEFDYHAAFQARPASIQMPEFDRLRQESFFANRASSPGGDTMEAMATYLTGRSVTEFKGRGPRFHAKLASGQTIPLSAQPTVFSQARRLGVDTAVAGWWLPYCQMLAVDLSLCKQVSAVSIRPDNWWESLIAQWKLLVYEHWLLTRFTDAGRERVPWAGWEFRRDQNLAYQFMMREALPLVAAPGGRLVLLHFPIPHPLGIYDRERNELSLTAPSNSLDNLELADRTLGELRQAMEAAGQWDQTTLVITSDHPLRPKKWEPFSSWTPEERDLIASRPTPLIPLCIKLAGSHAPLEWNQPFNNRSLPSLILATLRGEIRTSAQVAEFLSKPHEGL